MHLLRQPIHLPASVTEDDGLRDSHRLVQVAQSIQLPFLLFDGDVELFDTFQSQFVPLDQNPNRLSHELLRYFEHIGRHSGGEKNDLGFLGEELEDLVDLVLETTRQHFICFIETEDLNVVGPEGPAVDHIVDTTGSTDDDLNALLQLGHVFTDVGATDTGVAIDVHVVAESDNDLLNLLSELTGRCEDESLGGFNTQIELLEDGDGKGCSLASTGLGLSDDIVTLDDGDDCTLLDSGRTLETMGGEKTSEVIARFTPQKRTRKRRYRGEVLVRDPCCRSWFKEDPSAIPEVVRRTKIANLSTTWSQLDSISLSWTS